DRTRTHGKEHGHRGREVAVVRERRREEGRQGKGARYAGCDEASRRDGRQVELGLARLSIVPDDDLAGGWGGHHRLDAGCGRNDLDRVEDARAERDRDDVGGGAARRDQQDERPAADTHPASTLGTPAEPFKAACAVQRRRSERTYPTRSHGARGSSKAEA